MITAAILTIMPMAAVNDVAPFRFALMHLINAITDKIISAPSIARNVQQLFGINKNKNSRKSN